jgi:hypothetical protein
MRILLLLLVLCGITACTTFNAEDFRKDLESNTKPVVSSDSVVAGYPPRVFSSLTDGAHVFVTTIDTAGPRTIDAKYEATLSTDTAVVLSGNELGPYVTMSVAMRNVTAVYPVEKYPDYRTLTLGSRIMIGILAVTIIGGICAILGGMIATALSSNPEQPGDLGRGIGYVLGAAMAIYLTIHL